MTQNRNRPKFPLVNICPFRTINGDNIHPHHFRIDGRGRPQI